MPSPSDRCNICGGAGSDCRCSTYTRLRHREVKALEKIARKCS